jgi:hypothetical protein
VKVLRTCTQVTYRFAVPIGHPQATMQGSGRRFCARSSLDSSILALENCCYTTVGLANKTVSKTGVNDSYGEELTMLAILSDPLGLSESMFESDLRGHPVSYCTGLGKQKDRTT